MQITPLIFMALSLYLPKSSLFTMHESRMRETKWAAAEIMETQIKPKNGNFKARAIYACTGLPPELQNIIEQYRLDPTLFLPIIGTMIQINTHGPIILTQPLPENRVAVLHDQDPVIRIYDICSGNKLKIVSGHTDVIVFMTVIDNLLMTGSKDTTVRIWDRASGECLHILKGHTGSIISIAPRPNNHIATTSWDGTVRIWNLKNGSCVKTLYSRGDPGHTTAINLPNNYLITVKARQTGNNNDNYIDSELIVWDTRNQPRYFCKISTGFYPFPIKLFSNGNITVYNGDNIMHLLDPYKGKNLKKVSCRAATMEVTSSDLLVTGHDKERLETHKSLTGQAIQRILVNRPFDSFTLLPNNFVATEAHDCVLILDLKTGLCQNEFQKKSSPGLNQKTHMLEDGTFLFQEDTTSLCVYRPDAQSRELLEELAETDAYENLAQLISILNEKSHGPDQEIFLPDLAIKLYRSMPIEIQEKLKAHYNLAFKPEPEHAFDHDMSECGYMPCTIL